MRTSCQWYFLSEGWGCWKGPEIFSFRHLYIYGPDAAGEGTLKQVTGGDWQVEDVVAVDEEKLRL